VHPLHRSAPIARKSLEIDQSADGIFFKFRIAQITIAIAQTNGLVIKLPIETTPPKRSHYPHHWPCYLAVVFQGYYRHIRVGRMGWICQQRNDTGR